MPSGYKDSSLPPEVVPSELIGLAQLHMPLLSSESCGKKSPSEELWATLCAEYLRVVCWNKCKAHPGFAEQ
jgi:hypothetical protein